MSFARRRKNKRQDQKEKILIATNLLTIGLFLIFGRSNDCLSTAPQELLETADSNKNSTQILSSSREYRPSRLENRIMEHSMSDLHYDIDNADECDLFQNKNRSDFYEEYHDYLKMLEVYEKALREFDAKLEDIRKIPQEKRTGICQSMDDVLKGAFQAPDVALSLTREGYVEPLLPPLRHPRFCDAVNGLRNPKYILTLTYLVHDFGLICRQLDSQSKTVFIDMGASLQFHKRKTSPSMQLVDLYQKFGIKFDHYYAFEATEIHPNIIYRKVPEDIFTSFHWFNVPVLANESSRKNPWTSIVSQFDENDLVIVKLDIDNADVEMPLVEQLIQDKNARLVDHFYFEHHVRMKHMVEFWTNSALGTLQQSLDLFTTLRKAGVAAHSWV